MARPMSPFPCVNAGLERSIIFSPPCKCADKYERGGAIDGSTNLSIDFILFGGPVRDETGETHRRSRALIHGWREYSWIINLYEWGATYHIC